MLKLGAIFWRRLKMELDQSLECSAFLGVAREAFRLLPKIIPTMARGNKSIPPAHDTRRLLLSGPLAGYHTASSRYLRQIKTMAALIHPCRSMALRRNTLPCSLRCRSPGCAGRSTRGCPRSSFRASRSALAVLPAPLTRGRGSAQQ